MALDRDVAADGWNTRMGPKDEASQSSAASMRFGPFEPGDWITVSCLADFCVNCGDETVAATTGNPPLTAGPHDFVLPEGCTHVAVIPEGGSAARAGAWKTQRP